MIEFLKKINPCGWYRKIKDYNRIKKNYERVIEATTFGEYKDSDLGYLFIQTEIDRLQKEYYFAKVKEGLQPILKSGNMRSLKTYIKSL